MQAAINDADDKHPALPRRQQSLAVVYNFLYNAAAVLDHLNLCINWLCFAVNGCHSDSPDLPQWFQRGTRKSAWHSRGMRAVACHRVACRYWLRACMDRCVRGVACDFTLRAHLTSMRALCLYRKFP
jgi:hypothetical protein